VRLVLVPLHLLGNKRPTRLVNARTNPHHGELKVLLLIATRIIEYPRDRALIAARGARGHTNEAQRLHTDNY